MCAQRSKSKTSTTSSSTDSKEKETKRPPSATDVVKQAKLRLQLFHTPQNEAFASIEVKDHFESYPIGDPLFERWLFAMSFHDRGMAPSSQAVAAASKVLAGMAIFENPERSVQVRMARRDQVIYVDLADKERNVVRITSEGWNVIRDVPVRFWRPSGMRPLPLPKRGGTIGDLRPFLNLADQDQWYLCLSWLTGALNPDGSFPPLILEGAHGAGKTTLARVLRDLIDPSVAPVRAMPADLRDLRISANNAWCLSFDNLSHVSAALCDALCGLSTGGAFSTRELYTNDGERIFEGRRPIIMNGIDLGLERADLLDRAISLALPTMSDTKRETDAALWERFETVRPYILGSLYDAVACAIRRQPEVKLTGLPRMAGFITWNCAAAPALGLIESDLLTSYGKNRDELNGLGLEASTLYEPIARVVEEASGHWEGTATKLLSALAYDQINDPPEVRRYYPATAQGLSQQLRRLIPNFARVGISITFYRSPGSGSERLISIKRNSDACDATKLSI